ncbi:MAG TPA: peptidoglycan DD-metalloendopeptidase family protein [Usitatibacter sp.]|jgi:septal ring factor EnvC (AmiA/AmiB activator)|nr:peptidoglycan DD-metalloendopeptidase family protein [Usitatibacter sp.]
MAAGRALRLTAAALFAGAALAAAAAHPKPAPARPSAPAPTEDDLRQLRERIEKVQADLAAREETRSEAAEELKASGVAASQAQRALFDLGQKRKSIEADLASMTDQERAAREGIARQQALAAKLLRLQYEQGAPDRLRLLLEGKDAATVSRELAYYGYIQRARAALILHLREEDDRLAALAAQASQRRDELRDNEGAQADEARNLERERAKRASLVARLAGDIARGRKELGRLKRDETRLTRLVEEIARALARKQARDANKGGRRVDQVADASLASRPFETLKGLLRLPVKGELANRFGAPREETAATWKGLFIRCVSGETVHAVADGRVVYADWLRGFGNLLILDHGKGYMSLYANNEGLLRTVGESVRSGDPIARVGASDVAAESGLYFELRRDGKPFDPLGWVAP